MGDKNNLVQKCTGLFFDYFWIHGGSDWTFSGEQKKQCITNVDCLVLFVTMCHMLSMATNTGNHNETKINHLLWLWILFFIF